MKHHRFIGDFDFSLPQLTVHDPKLLHQWKRVLRLKKGQEMILVNRAGEEVRAMLDTMCDTEASCHILEHYHGTREPNVGVHLYCSILKRENFELVVQKATEIGVTHIIPVIAHRTVKLGTRTDRLERIAKEAAEQCGRAIIPVIEEPVSFEEAVNMARKHANVLFFDVGAKEQMRKSKKGNDIGLFIGPEGGWDESEQSQAKEAGFFLCTLGDLILRAETAAIVASFIVIQTKGLEK